MKIERHAKIIELINEYAIETQEELASRLNDAGFRVTPGYGVQRYSGAEADQDGSKRTAAICGGPRQQRSYG